MTDRRQLWIDSPMEQRTRKDAAPVLAATVILARQHREGLQIYLLKRHPRSAFMAGKFVFPGGMVEPTTDRASAWQEHVDINLEKINLRFGGDLTGPEALSYAVAAIRETFEEAGVLLVDRANLSSRTLERVCEMRLGRGMKKGWFFRQANAEGWILKLSALSRWSHWMTPKQMPRRYDTRFFLAIMPRGQVCRPDDRETTHGIWISPAKGLAANLAGDVPLSPPTLVVLNELMAFTSVENLLASARGRSWGPALLPRLIPLKNGAVIIEPWDAEYHKEEIAIDICELEKQILPVGAPFSGFGTVSACGGRLVPNGDVDLFSNI